MSTLLYNTEKGLFGNYSGNSLYEIADNIKKNICPKDIVIININMCVGSDKQKEDQQGIELLVRLRLAGIMNHCILHSYETLFDVIAKNPRNSIVTSHGTSFQRTAFNPQDYVTDKENPSEANKIDFVSHLKKYYDIGEIRHRLANKYGVYILSQIYNDYFRDATTEIEIFCHLPDEDKLVLDVYKYIANRDDISKNRISVIKDINTIRRSFTNSRPCVLYIDDMANDGWENLLVKSIYTDQDRDRFIVNVPQKTDFDDCNYSTYFNKICEIISADRKQRFIECVLLDVRLLDEQGVYEEIEKLSGIRLLKDIREKFPELPIIIITASNKAETVSHVIKSGATALWTKPGIDYIYSDDYYLVQYLQLLRYVLNAQKKYKDRLEKQIAKARNAIASFSINTNIVKFKNYYSDIDAIVFDTNIFAFTEKPSDLHKVYLYIYKIYKWAKQNKKLFIVIDDVYSELLIHSRKQDISKYELKKVSEFALQIIGYYLTDTSNNYHDLKDNSQTKWDIKEEKNLLDQNMHIVFTIHKQNRFCHTDKKEAEKYMSKANKKELLHADDPLAYLVPFLCCKEKKNVLFIANDGELKKRIAIEAMVRYGVNTVNIIDKDSKYFNEDNRRISCFEDNYIEMIPHWCMRKLFYK
jgi:CheY-like chemotaxis protein